ncbi:MAG: EAL domain-containing protein [Pseudomonadota bacterium]
MSNFPKFPSDTDILHSVTTVLESLESVAKVDAQSPQEATAPRVLLFGYPRSFKKWDLRWLQRSNFELTLLESADNALQHIETMDPDAIIVEARMRGNDGSELYEEILQSGRVEAPVFVLTSSPVETKSAMDNGAFDIIRKPFDWRLINRRIKNAVDALHREIDLDHAHGSLDAVAELTSQLRLKSNAAQSFEPITGLPNRSKFEKLIACNTRAVEKDGNVIFCAVISLNRFNLITEALGVDKSNEIIAKAAEVLKLCISDTVSYIRQENGLRTASIARIGPGRFAVMMTASTGDDELDHIRQFVIGRFTQPMIIDGQSLYLSPCIGAAVYPTDTADLSQLLGKSEAAMREARSRSLTYLRHSHSFEEEIANRLHIENQLHAALEKSELQVAYQPLVDIQSDRIVGCEALLRWPQPDGSFLSPAEFVPVAESAGIMVRIGEFVLDAACSQLASWRNAGLPAVRMSVNVSKCQLENDQFPAYVRHCLQKHQIEPRLLDLELSERGTLTPSKEIISRLHALKELGVSLSIDDFGTGEAAIAYLKELPVDVLKIDRSYVTELKSNASDTAITSAMVSLGKGLNLTVVAEGVESKEQLRILKDMGCDQYQGFYRSPAVSPAALTEQLSGDE